MKFNNALYFLSFVARLMNNLQKIKNLLRKPIKKFRKHIFFAHNCSQICNSTPFTHKWVNMACALSQTGQMIKITEYTTKLLNGLDVAKRLFLLHTTS